MPVKYLADLRSRASSQRYVSIYDDQRPKIEDIERSDDGGEIGGSGVHFPSTPVKYLADLRSRANSQQYSSIYEDQRPKIDDIERSDGKKSA